MNNFNPAMNNSYNPSMIDNGVINPASGGVTAIVPGNPSMIKLNQMQESAINPGLLSNMDAIKNLNPGSAYNQAQPIMPPNGVQTSITPAMGIENQ